MPPLRRKPGPKSATTKPKDKKSPKIIKQSKRKSDNDDDDDPDDPDSISDLSEQDLKSDKEEDDVSITFSDFSDSSNGEHSKFGKQDLKGLSEKEKSFLESSDDDEDNAQPVKPSGPTNRPKPASAKKNDASNKSKPASAKKTETSDKPKPASAKKTETSDKPKPASAKKTETLDKPKPASAKKTETSDKPKPASAKKTETSDKPKPASANKENSSGKPNFSTSIKDNSENKMTPDVKSTVCEPIKLNQYYRHKCKLASVASSKQITGQDICKPGRAAELTMEKLKLHYVVHYLYGGTWDHLVPEEEPHLLGKIEYYLCNICNKRFKNHLEKKEYPGRGSVLCHLATDHGLLLDAMLNDECVDLKEDIQILSQIDNQFKDAVDNGSEISKMKLDQLVTAKDSMIWRLSQQKQKQGETNGAATPKVQTTNTNSSSSVSNSSSATPNSPKHVEDSSLDKPTSNEEGDTKNEKSESVNRPSLLECPHCDELRGNDDAPNLRLHIFHHYKDHWLKKLDDISSDDNTYFCDRCPRKRKITGATLEGTKTAVVCHFAIQHYELRAVLEEDKTLQKNFVKELYWDHDNPNSSNSSYYQSQTKVIKSQAPARTPQSKRSAAMSSSEGDDVATSDLSSFEMSLSDSDGSVKKKKCNPTKRSVIKSNPQPGDVNPNYIRKRAKIDFTLDSDDDDTASDHSWKKSSSKKKVRSTRKKPVSPTSNNANELQKKARILPKRGATKNKNFSFLNEDDEDDE